MFFINSALLPNFKHNIHTPSLHSLHSLQAENFPYVAHTVCRNLPPDLLQPGVSGCYVQEEDERKADLYQPGCC